MRGPGFGYASPARRAQEGAVCVALVVVTGALAACAADPAATPMRATTQPTGPVSATMEAAQAASGSWWRPRPGQSWQWQLSGLPVDTSIAADIYDLDLFETSRETVAQLDSQGRRVICYLSAGTFEHWRPDVGLFPQGVIGRPYVGCPGEWWLDIRQMDVLAPIIEARLDLCQGKGFDGVEPDNIDAYQAATGFPLSSQDQLNFNRWLARAAHARGLSIGLKNDPDQAMDLADDFDWALGEDCSAQGWCEAFASFVARGKLVVAVEYTDSGVDWQAACTQTRRLGFSMVLKNRDLDAWLATCP